VPSLYEVHSSNLRLITTALNGVERDLRYYVARSDDPRVAVYTRLLTHLVTAWAEVRVLKLAYEPGRFSPQEIASILQAETAKHRWLLSLEISVRKAYSVSSGRALAASLTFTPHARYLALVELIESELLPSIELRNRIAHGQWEFALSNDLRSVNGQLTQEMQKQNIVTLQLRRRIFESLGQLIHNLAVSPVTFERDFDAGYRTIEQQRNNLHHRDYAKYEQAMVAKYRRGLAKRRAATGH
jgi:hypothetical protein